ncbi:MAG: hypothetical protein SFY32_10855 [Bacteroidota bacterium]|nr:hypothetical protein [Bacteroidota bacterium]
MKLGKSISEVDTIISEAFRRFFMSYAKSINKQENRTGSLFQKNFKRKEITNQSYFTSVVLYIHANPQKHGICGDFTEYPHSSFGRILMDKSSKLQKLEILNWFGSKESYFKFHQTNKNNIHTSKEFYIEE